jgi:hypothetical protein
LRKLKNLRGRDISGKAVRVKGKEVESILRGPENMKEALKRPKKSRDEAADIVNGRTHELRRLQTPNKGDLGRNVLPL